MRGGPELILQQIEEAFYQSTLDRIRKQGHPLPQHPIAERELDKAQGVSFRWTGDDGIDRSVNGYLKEKAGVSQLIIEVNAWLDNQQDRSRRGVRRWRNLNVASLSTPPDLEELSQSLGKTYDLVSGWGRRNLRRRTILQPLPITR